VALPLLDALGQAVQAELALPAGRFETTAPTFGSVTAGVSRAQRNASCGVADSDVRAPLSRRARGHPDEHAMAAPEFLADDAIAASVSRHDPPSSQP
jgi:hypothetical protein